MKKFAIAAFFASFVLLGAFGQEAKATATTTNGFRTEGSIFIATGTATGANVEEAEEKARSAALRELFAGIGKDRLFAEVFIGSPPLGLSFEEPTTTAGVIGFSSTVTLRIDDESVRIVERGPYLASAIGLLDKAELASDEAQAQMERAHIAESQASLGDALGAYGMAKDGAGAALTLVDPIGDASIFSTKGKRSVAELKRNLAGLRDGAAAGIERVRAAEAVLAADASGKEAEKLVDDAIGAADQAQAFLDEIAPTLEDPSSQSEEKLSALRERLALQRRTLSDSKTALDRASTALPKDRRFIADKLDFARRRLASTDASLAAAFRTVDREIRDPAARRAERAQAIRWVFLHEPREYISFRAYLPFDLEAGNPKGIQLTDPDFRLGLEGAFTFGDGGGVWVRSQGMTVNTDLSPSTGSLDEFALTQSLDFGFWGRTLFFGGFTWDWLRSIGPNNVALPKAGLIRLGLGGIGQGGSGTENFRRADWLLALTYELPYKSDSFIFSNAFNLGIESQFRLGSIALLEASVSHRLHRKAMTGASTDFSSVFRWAIALGIRLPSPFAWGIEYGGDLVWPMKADGNPGGLEPFKGGRFRFFLQYSI